MPSGLAVAWKHAGQIGPSTYHAAKTRSASAHHHRDREPAETIRQINREGTD